MKAAATLCGALLLTACASQAKVPMAPGEKLLADRIDALEADLAQLNAELQELRVDLVPVEQMSEDEFAPDGVISSVGLDRLRELMPESSARIVPGLRVSQILSLFSVTTFARIVENKLASQTPAS